MSRLMRSVRGLLSSSRSSAAWVSPPEPDFCALRGEKRREAVCRRFVSLARGDRSGEERSLGSNPPQPPEERWGLVITGQRAHTGPRPTAQATEAGLDSPQIKQDQGCPWKDVDVHVLWRGLYLSNHAEMRGCYPYLSGEKTEVERS